MFLCRFFIFFLWPAIGFTVEMWVRICRILSIESLVSGSASFLRPAVMSIFNPRGVVVPFHFIEPGMFFKFKCSVILSPCSFIR